MLQIPPHTWKRGKKNWDRVHWAEDQLNRDKTPKKREERGVIVIHSSPLQRAKYAIGATIIERDAGKEQQWNHFMRKKLNEEQNKYGGSQLTNEHGEAT